jgi:hypothetical protein
MLGKASAQRGLFEADHLYLEHVGRDSFYGFLASQRGQLFRDEDFAALYCADNGRRSVPPSLLATVLLLQTYEGVSDEEATARAAFDLRWKVALGIGLDERPFAKSTLQLFRAHLVLHEHVQAVFRKSLAFARQTGYLKGAKMRVVLDTTYILGRGAVKDTYNLLADGIVALARVLATREGSAPPAWAAAHGLTRYFGTSLKGEAAIEWDDPAARRRLLGEVVADADRLLETARPLLTDTSPEDGAHRPLREAAEILARLLLQDVERRPDGPALKQGVSEARIVSVHDPEMRHGRKSAAKRFDGHKAAVAVDPASQLITAATVLAGNAQDDERALELVEQAEENAAATVEEAIGDCAYGAGETRQAFAAAKRRLVARVRRRPEQVRFPKEDFRIDLAAETCVCPAGQECRSIVRIGGRKDRTGQALVVRGFQFDAAVCDACPLRAACVGTGPGKGRTVSLHPQEALLQEARALQRSDAFAPYRTLRQAAEHRLARLMQLGLRQARYVGRAKTLGQLLLAATVANLTLVARHVGLMGRRSAPLPPHHVSILIGLLARITGMITDLHRPDIHRTPAFRPRF